MTSPAVSLMWQRQSVWSQAASRLKARITRARVAALVLIILGAALGTAASQVFSPNEDLGRVFAACAAGALALAAIAGQGSSLSLVRDWTRARSVSEAIKSDVYRYLTGIAPYHEADRDEVALRELDELLASTGDLVRHTTAIDPTGKPLPAVHDLPSYVEVRVAQQLTGYYRPKARQMAGRVRLTRAAVTTLGTVAAVLAAVVAFFPSAGISAWIGVLTTVAAAVGAHAGAVRYEYQQIEFTRTADELERLSTGAPTADVHQFVLDCERVISIQNEGWMAKLGSAQEE